MDGGLVAAWAIYGPVVCEIGTVIGISSMAGLQWAFAFRANATAGQAGYNLVRSQQPILSEPKGDLKVIRVSTHPFVGPLYVL